MLCASENRSGGARSSRWPRKPKIPFDERQLGHVERTKPAGPAEFGEVHHARMNAVVAQTPVQGEQPVAQRYNLLRGAKRRIGEQRPGGLSIEQSELAPERVELHERIVCRNVKTPQRPSQHDESFEPPGGFNLLALIETADRSLQHFPFVGLKFVVDADVAYPGKQFLSLALPACEHPLEPARPGTNIGAGLFQDRSASDGRKRKSTPGNPLCGRSLGGILHCARRRPRRSITSNRHLGQHLGPNRLRMLFAAIHAVQLAPAGVAQ